MITEVILPKLGQTMEEGAIVEWFKEEGEAVSRGDMLFSVESDKAVLEVEATTRGYLRKILVPAGEAVPVLTPVALITRETDEPLDAYQLGDETAAAQPTVGALEPTAAEPEDGSDKDRAGDRIFASPRARKTAREKGIDLSQVSGTGPNDRIVEQDVLDYVELLAAGPKATPVAVRTAGALGVDLAALAGTGTGGRITKADVEEAAAAASQPEPSPVEAPAIESMPVTGLRRIVAERMAASDQATARVTLITEADATAFVEARTQLVASVVEEWGFAPGYNDLLGLIVARALGEFPYMNARLSEDGSAIERLSTVNLGVAVDTERGLLVPVIRNAGQMGLRAFGTEFRRLMERARTGKSLP
ncbi:MAG: 2-oxo acid dehydrogenase subunit E2, partial [Anaerolineae bacterium]